MEGLQAELDLVIRLNQQVQEITSLLSELTNGIGDLTDAEDLITEFSSNIDNLLYECNKIKYGEIEEDFISELEDLIYVAEQKAEIQQILDGLSLLLANQEINQDEEGIMDIENLLNSVIEDIDSLQDGTDKNEFMQTYINYSDRLEIVKEKLFVGNPKVRLKYYMQILDDELNELYYMTNEEEGWDIAEVKGQLQFIKDLHADLVILLAEIPKDDETYEELESEINYIGDFIEEVELEVSIFILYMEMGQIGIEFEEVSQDLQNGILFEMDYIVEI